MGRLEPGPSDCESDVRRRSGWLKKDLACSRWMPRRSRRLQTDPDGSRRIVWMIIGMIKAHPTEIGWQGEHPDPEVSWGAAPFRWPSRPGERDHTIPDADARPDPRLPASGAHRLSAAGIARF